MTTETDSEPRPSDPSRPSRMKTPDLLAVVRLGMLCGVAGAEAGALRVSREAFAGTGLLCPHEHGGDLLSFDGQGGAALRCPAGCEIAIGARMLADDLSEAVAREAVARRVRASAARAAATAILEAVAESEAPEGALALVSRELAEALNEVAAQIEEGVRCPRWTVRADLEAQTARALWAEFEGRR